MAGLDESERGEHHDAQQQDCQADHDGWGSGEGLEACMGEAGRHMREEQEWGAGLLVGPTVTHTSHLPGFCGTHKSKMW